MLAVFLAASGMAQAESVRPVRSLQATLDRYLERGMPCMLLASVIPTIISYPCSGKLDRAFAKRKGSKILLFEPLAKAIGA